MNDQLQHRVHVGPLMSRRQLLRVGAAGCMGLTLPRLFAAESSSGSSRVKSCILIFYYGGPSHLDTWDMKPNAPGKSAASSSRSRRRSPDYECVSTFRSRRALLTSWR